jgi:hypothetical protein
VVVAHKGKLVDIAQSKGNLPLARLREFPQPRTGIFSAYKALIEILIAAGLLGQECLLS